MAGVSNQTQAFRIRVVWVSTDVAMQATQEENLQLLSVFKYNNWWEMTNWTPNLIDNLFRSTQNLRNPMIVDPSPMSFHSRFPQFTLDRRWAVEPPKRPSQNAWSCRWETQVIMICNKDSCYVSYSVSLFVASGIKDDKGLYSSILLLALLQARNSIDIQSIGWQAQQCRTCLLSNEGKIPPDVKWHLPLMMQKSRKC